LDEVRIELLGVLEGGDGLGGVEDDVVAVVDHFAAVRPQAPMGPAVGVPRRMAQREPWRLTYFLESLAQFEEPRCVAGTIVEAGGAHGADAVVERACRAALRQRDPPVAAHAIFPRDGIPA